MTTTPLVSVVIVTWNCARLIDRCLDLLFASSVDAIETIVVDNASGDSTCAKVRARSEPVVLIESPANLGFGRGCNLGAARARSPFLLFLNPDAFLEDPAVLGRLVAVLAAEQRIAAVAPRLIFQDRRHQVGDAGYRPSLRGLLAHQLLLSRFSSRARGFYVNNAMLLRRDEVEVDWLSGACLLVRREAFEAAGGFAGDVFLYGEDVDLGVRLREAGHRLVYLPQLRVVHLQGGTQRADTEQAHVSTRWIDSLFTQAGGDRDAARRLALRVVLCGGFVVRAIGYAGRGLLPRGRRHRAQAWAMVAYGRYALFEAGSR